MLNPILESLGITAHWNFDEESGLTVYDNINQNNGTIHNATRVNELNSGALSFDNNGDYVRVPHDETLNFGTGDFTISFQIQTDSSELDVFVDKRVEDSGPMQGYVVFNYYGKLGFELADGLPNSKGDTWTNYISNISINDGLPHHVTVSIDRDNPEGGRWYIDGQLAETFNPTGRQGSLDTNKDLVMGNRSDAAWSGYLDGTLDDVQLFNQAFDDTQAQTLYEISQGNNPMNTEFKVNTYTAGNQDKPNVTALSNGGFVVVWESTAQDGDLDGIFAQEYDKNQQPVGTEFQVNSYTTSNQRDPVVVGLDNGTYVVAWRSNGQDGDLYGIFGQRYTNGGVAVGGEFQLNTETFDDQWFPALSPLNDGGFVAVWQSYLQDGDSWAIIAQRFNSADEKVGNEIQVNTTTANSQLDPTITMLNNGNFVVVWDSLGQDGSSLGVYGRLYDSNGNPLTGEFQVNTYTQSNQNDAAIAALKDGGFVIIWESFGQDTDSLGIYGQRYDSNGNKVEGEFQVNTYTTSIQQDASVTALPDGGFIVAWESFQQDGESDGIYGQRYDSNGNKVEGEFQVNTYTTSNQSHPSVTTFNNGKRVFVWQSSGQDGDGTGIYSRIYSSQDPIDLSLTNDTIAENEPVGTVIGNFSTIDPDSNSHTYSLVAGEGDIDNSKFQIVDNTLQTTEVLNHEDKEQLKFRVKVTDNEGGTYEQQFTINVTDVNEPPTDLSLENNTIAENEPINTVIGNFSTVDPDEGDTHTYTLVAGEGSADNSKFQIVDNTLQTTEALDHEDKEQLNIRVEVTDSKGETYQQPFTINVTDVNEAPEGITISSNEIEENAANGTVVGQLSTIDPDVGDDHTYTLVDDAGGRFQIVGKEIQVADGTLLDFETNTNHTITVRTTDSGGLTKDEILSINVTDVVEVIAPVFQNLGEEISVEDTMIILPSDIATDEDGTVDNYTISNIQLFDSEGNIISDTPLQTVFTFEYIPSEGLKFSILEAEGIGKIALDLTAIDNDENQTTEQLTLTLEKSQFVGYVIDGYIAGATVFFDIDKDGILDENEPYTTTDEKGFYNLNFLDQFKQFDKNENGQIDPDEGTITVIGGVDISTGLPLDVPLRANPYAGVVTALTTLVADLTDKLIEEDGIDPATAEEMAKQSISDAFNIPDGVDINDFDPIAAIGSDNPDTAMKGQQTFISTIKFQTVITMVAGLFAGVTGHIRNLDKCNQVNELDREYVNIVEQVTKAANAQLTSSNFDLTTNATIEAIINVTATNLGSTPTTDIVSSAATIIAEVNQRISGISENFEEGIAKIQKVASGEITDELEQVGLGNLDFPIATVKAENTGTNLDIQIAAAIVNSAAPTDIDIIPNTSNAFIDPNNDEIINILETGTFGAASKLVGKFTSEDADTDSTQHHYCLVSGEGDDDNHKFEIVETNGEYQLHLKATEIFDYEVQNQYSVRVQSNDGDGGIRWEQLQINVISEPEPTTTIQYLDQDVLIGETQSFRVIFDNTADADRGNIGYSPFIDLFLDSSGTDGDDGVTLNGNLSVRTGTSGNFTSLNNFGITPIEVVITGDGDTVEHPYAGVIDVPNEYGVGDTLVVIPLPQTSFAPNDPNVELRGTLQVSDKADYQQPLNIASRGGFRFGANPSLDPSDPLFKQGNTSTTTLLDSSDSISPHLFRVTNSGPQTRINHISSYGVTGPNFDNYYRLYLQIAGGQTIDNLDLINQLDDSVQHILGTHDSNQTQTPNNFTVDPNNGLGSLITANYLNAKGNIQLDLPFYIPRIEKNGIDYVIDPDTGVMTSSLNQTFVKVNSWTPLDTRDTAEVNGPISIVEDDGDTDWIHQNEAITVQTSVGLAEDNQATGWGPGDVAEHTVTFSLSDYFALGNVDIVNTFSDGQIFDNSFTPTVIINEHDSTFTPTVTYTENGNTVTFNIDDGDGKLLGGRISEITGYDPSLPFGATTGTLKFRTVIQEDFTNTDLGSVSVGDRFSNSATIRGDILEVDDPNTLFTSGNQISDSRGRGWYLNSSNFSNDYQVGVYGINGDYYQGNNTLNYPNLTEVAAGDDITYRIRYSMPFEDIKGLTFNANLPLPVLDVNDLALGSIPNWNGVLPTAGNVKYGPTHTFGGSTTPTIDPDTNSVIFNYGDRSVVNSEPVTVDILFTVEVGSEPTQDQLLLSSFFEQNQKRVSSDRIHDRSPWRKTPSLELLQPNLNITQGIVAFASQDDDIIFSQTLPFNFTAPGTSGVRFDGNQITSELLTTQPFNSDLIGQNIGDGLVPGDLVTFAIIIENTGTSPNGAFDVVIKDILPEGFKVPQDPATTTNNHNLTVTDGNGNPLTYENLGAGPDQLDNTNDDIFGHGIRLIDNGTTGAINTYDPNSGDNIAVITFDLEVDSPVTTGDVITNTAVLEEYANIEGGLPFLAGILTEEESASIIIGERNELPYFNESYIGTILSDQDGDETNDQFSFELPADLFLDLEDNANSLSLTYNLTNIPDGLILRPDSSSPNFILEGIPSFPNNTVPITITATDSGGGTASYDVLFWHDFIESEIIITGKENTAPYFNELYSGTILEDQDGEPENDEFTFEVPSDLFVDLERDYPLRYELANIPSGLTLINPNSPTFTLSGNLSGDSSIKVIATDTQGSSSSRTFFLIPDKQGISIFGLAIDGYLSGATVFLDVNNNGELDEGEFSTITDENGFYSLELPQELDINGNGIFDPEEGTIIAIGGVDTATGLTLETPLKATGGSQVISPLTTLIAQLVDQGLTVAEANTKVTNAFGLRDIQLNFFDHIEATNNNQPGALDISAATVKVQNVIAQTAHLLSGLSSVSISEVANNAIATIANYINTDTPLDLSNETQLKTLLEDTAAITTETGVDVSSVNTEAAQVMAEANLRIDNLVSDGNIATIETSFAKVQKVALGTTADALLAAGTGTKSITEVRDENTGDALDSKISQANLDLTIVTANNLNLGEADTISLDHNVQTITFDHTYNEPVIFAPSVSFNGNQLATPRITNITNNSFDIYLQEPSNEDGFHTSETLSYFVFESGTYQLSDGTLVEVGTLNTDSTATPNDLTLVPWQTVEFDIDFTDTPVIFSQVQTDNESDLVRTRQQNATSNGFEVVMEEDEINARNSEGHLNETIGYLAIASGSGTSNGVTYQAASTDDSVTHKLFNINFGGEFTNIPHFLANIATYDGPDPSALRFQNLTTNGVQVTIQEDTTFDNETNHTTEVVNYLAIEGDNGLQGTAYDPLTGNRAIIGTDSNDYILGLSENDTRTGKDGSDVFVLETDGGTDTITDFELGIDLIGLTDGLSFGALTLTDIDNDTSVMFDSQELAILKGIQSTELTSDHFVGVNV